MTSKSRESGVKWYSYRPYGTAANICLFICGQVEVLIVTQGCFYCLPVCHFGNVGGRVGQ